MEGETVHTYTYMLGNMKTFMYTLQFCDVRCIRCSGLSILNSQLWCVNMYGVLCIHAVRALARVLESKFIQVSLPAVTVERTTRVCRKKTPITVP